MVPLVEKCLVSKEEKCLVSRHCCMTAKPKELLLTLRLRVFTDYIFQYMWNHICVMYSKSWLENIKGRKRLDLTSS